MSPMARDGEWRMEKFGRRPVEHLADIGILGDNVVIMHLVHSACAGPLQLFIRGAPGFRDLDQKVDEGPHF